MYIVLDVLLTVCECQSLSDPVKKTMKKRERFVNEEMAHQSKWGLLSEVIQRVISSNIKSVSHELVELCSDKYP